MFAVAVAALWLGEEDFGPTGIRYLPRHRRCGLRLAEGRDERASGERRQMDFGEHYLENAGFEFGRLKQLAEAAMEQIRDDAGFHIELDDASNSIAVILQHLNGNMVSRWTDFLTSDGEKPDRYRDREFEAQPDRTRDELMAPLGARLVDALRVLRRTHARRTRAQSDHPRRRAHRTRGHSAASRTRRLPCRPDRVSRPPCKLQKRLEERERA